MLRLLFDWDAHNIDHLARHCVRPEEAEGALLDERRIGTAAYTAGGEARSAYIGTTEAGRTLLVVVTRRRGRVRVVTARPADRAEAGRYRQRLK